METDTGSTGVRKQLEGHSMGFSRDNRDFSVKVGYSSLTRRKPSKAPVLHMGSGMVHPWGMLFKNY